MFLKITCSQSRQFRRISEEGDLKAPKGTFYFPHFLTLSREKIISIRLGGHGGAPCLLMQVSLKTSFFLQLFNHTGNLYRYLLIKKKNEYPNIMHVMRTFFYGAQIIAYGYFNLS